MSQITLFREKYRFLSNFYITSIKYEGLVYPSVEHAFQAAKVLDYKTRNKFTEYTQPSKARSMGRALKYIRPDWDSIKLGIMEELLRYKFSKPYLKHALLETNDDELIEGNWWNDTYWGVCKGQGSNNLGKLLMKIRKELKYGTFS